MARTFKLTTAQAIIRFLNNIYLQDNNKIEKFIYGFATIFGHGNVVGMGEALANESHSFKMFQGKSEQGMAQMAIGYAKQNNRQKIIACTTSIGPGSANLVTAAGVATVNNIPLLLFPGDTFASRRPDPVLQQIEQFHNLTISTNDSLKSVSKFWDRINRPEQLINSLPWAIKVLTDPENTGAVTICLPQDVQGETWDYPEWFFKKRIFKLKRPSEETYILEEASKILSKAKKPLAIIGGGSRYSLASKELHEFLKKFCIPFVSTQAGKSTLPSSSDLNLGGIGVTGNLSANLYAKEADIILSFGTRYSDFTTGSKSQFNKNVNFLNFNIRSFDALKMNGFEIKGDIKKNLTKFNQIFRKLNINFLDQKNNIQKYKSLWIKEYKRITTNSTILEIQDNNIDSATKFNEMIIKEFDNNVKVFSQTYILGLIRKYLKKNASITGAAGSLPGDMQRIWETDEFASYNMEYGYSCMGHEIQGAIGSSIALGYKPAYAFLGDGSFLMLHSEMHTAVQENIPVVIFLFDNGSFGCINNLQVGNQIKSFETDFLKREARTNKSTIHFNTNFSQIAKGYGFKSILIKTEKELIEVIKEANNTDVPMLIEIKVFPKSMTHGYESEWEIGLAQMSKIKKISDKAKKINTFFKEHNDY